MRDIIRKPKAEILDISRSGGDLYRLSDYWDKVFFLYVKKDGMIYVEDKYDDAIIRRYLKDAHNETSEKA